MEAKFLIHMVLLLGASSSVFGGLACLSSPCLHGVCLDDLNSTYFCYCIDGYTGIQCQTNWNECWSSPCINGGICIDGVATFNCSCPPGFIGERCEEDVNECDSNPCFNNGTCLDGTNGYQCSCSQGYSGVYCEIDVAVCNTTNETRCANGGSCVEGPGESFSCSCPPGWESPLCEEEIDECMPGPCRNGAVCIDLLADYTCACPFGRNCEDPVEICAENPCKNGALCLVEDRKPICYCVPDFHGELCQFQYDECQIGPKCMNGGTCVDGIDNSFCSCPPTLTGMRCECLILDGTTLDCTYITPKPTTTTETSFTIVTTTETEVPTTETTFLTESTTITVPQEESTIFISPETTSEISTSTWSWTSTFSTTWGTDSTTTESSLPITITPTVLISSSPQGRETNFSSTEETTTTEEFTTFTEFTSELNDGTTMVSFDCTKERCQNGGTCIYNAGFQCVCPFDAEGSFCEKKLGVRNAAFTGDSYLKHRLPDAKNVSFSFEAKTLYSEGLIFHSSLDSSYMILYLEKGHLQFKFSCGYQTMLLSELTVPVNNGFPIRIQANLEFMKNRTRCDATIKVNDTLTMMGDQVALMDHFQKKEVWLFLGGVPQEVSGSPTGGFIGCITKLKISGRFLDIFKDAEDGSGVGECSSLACLSNPCANGASCISKGENWSCSCKNGFLGTMCEISVCETNPCLFGGTCIPFSGSGYICLCPFGKRGHFCENDLKIIEPYFSSSIRGYSSYVAYPIPGIITDTMELKFRFTPSTLDQISILMFIGQKNHHDSYSDHIAVSFVKGFIMLTWNLGGGPRRIFTPQPVESASRTYQVSLGRTGRRAWLAVESLGNVTGRAPGTMVHLDVAPVLYLGGHESKNFSTLPHDLPLHSGFSGCIFDVQLISGNLVIPLQGARQVIGRAVGQCGASECHEQSCHNGGVCLHHASTFMCLCQDGWFGPICTYRRNPCDSSQHQCQPGSTCVPMMANYQCDCPIGKSGQFCEKDEDISDVSFTGVRSYLSLYSYEIENNNINIEMEIRPLANDGLLLFVQKKGSSFVSLFLQSGVLELKILSSSKMIGEPSTITSTKTLLKGVWYKLTLGIFGKKAYLSVDNLTTSTILPTDNGIYLSKERIYIGGLPDFSLLPLSASSKLPIPYKGCIRDFAINSLHIPLTRPNLLQGRNLGDCDGTPCGRDACLNGGTCWLDSSSKAHCNCPRPFFGEKCTLISECDEKECRNSGKCHEEKCSCQVGWEGAFCERRLLVTKPQFHGNSYLIVRKSISDKKRDIESGGLQVHNVYINFTTVRKEGLVLWSRKGDNFIGIGLENGFLKVAYSLRNGTIATLPFYYRVSDGLWHNIEISFKPLVIRLDQNKIAQKERFKEIVNNTIATDGLFYIGGIPKMDKIREETRGIFRHSFKGCIEGFGANDAQIIRDFSHFEGEQIDVCRVL